MACCGKSRLPIVRDKLGSLRRDAILGNAPMPEAVGSIRPSTPLGVCLLIAENGVRLPLEFTQGMLTVTLGSRRFELFSAIRSQGCLVEPFVELQAKWLAIRTPQREQVIKRIGSLTLQALLQHFEIPQPD